MHSLGLLKRFIHQWVAYLALQTLTVPPASTGQQRQDLQKTVCVSGINREELQLDRRKYLPNYVSFHCEVSAARQNATSFLTSQFIAACAKTATGTWVTQLYLL